MEKANGSGTAGKLKKVSHNISPERREELRGIAYRQLGVTRKQVEVVVRVSPHIARLMKQVERQGMPDDPWFYIGAAIGQDADLLLTARSRVAEKAQPFVPIEAYAIAVNVSPFRILELLVSTICRMGAETSAVIVASASPKVAESTVDLALNDPDGKVRLAAQTVIHRATGLLPTPKSAQTSITITQHAQVAATKVELESPEQTIRRLAEGMAKRNLLPPAEPKPAADDTLDAEIVEGDAEVGDEEL